MTKLLIVEDDELLAPTISKYLTAENYQVELLSDGEEAEVHLRTFEYDAIILDWNLPRMSGVQILRALRGRGKDTPVLMLTGKSQIQNKEEGLGSGADDYLTKPFDMRELLARIRALLRRASSNPSDTDLKAGSIRVDTKSHQVLVNGEPVALQPKEFQMLEFMLRHQNEILSGEMLLNRVWSSDSEATFEAVRSTLKRLRKKVDPDGTIIKTIFGIGYKIDSGVSE